MIRRDTLAGSALAVLVLLGATLTAPTKAAGVPASFDCGKAESTVEKMICAYAVLRWNDLALSRSYVAARQATSGPARDDLVLAQRDWVHERGRQCIADRTFAELSEVSTEIGRQAYDCLNSSYLTRRLRLHEVAGGTLSSDTLREIDLTPIAAARPEIADGGEVRISAIRVSPDGTMLAILLPSLELDGPDQAWLYRVADGRLTAATPMPDPQQPHPDGTPMLIGAMAWQGDTLYVTMTEWGGAGVPAPHAVYAAGRGQSTRLEAAPAAVAALLAADGEPAGIASDGLTADDTESPDALTGNDDFLAWINDLGHGTVELKMRKRAAGTPAYLVAWGGWALASYLFDADRSRLVYPADTGLAVLDMATRHERRIAGTSAGDRPYAISNASNLIVWSTRNACGDELLTEQDEAAPAHLCLAYLEKAQ